MKTFMPPLLSGAIRSTAAAALRHAALCVVTAGVLSQTVVAGQLRGKEAAKEPDATVTLPIELLANRPIVRVKVGEQGPLPLLVAPEAERSVIDHTALTPSEPTKGSAVPSEVDVTVGEATLKSGVGDTTRLLAAFGTSPARPRGIVSAASWPNRLVTLAYPRWQLVVETGTLPEPNGHDVFALAPADAEQGVRLVLAGHAIPCRVDPTVPIGVRLPEPTLRALPAAIRTSKTGILTLSISSMVGREVSLAPDVMIGGLSVWLPSALVGSAQEPCVIGGQVLMQFSLTYDLANARIRLTPRP